MKQVYFNDIRSWDDLGLFLPDNGVDISLPEVKRITVEVPGADGKLDLTSSLGDYARFRNRTIQLTFIVSSHKHNWEEEFSAVVQKLHAKRFHVWIEPDTDWYWNAYCTVGKIASSKNKGTISVGLDCDPYKYRDFETIISDDTAIVATASRPGISPSFDIPAGCELTVACRGETYIITSQNAGNNDLIFEEGDNLLDIAVNWTGIEETAITMYYKDKSL